MNNHWQYTSPLAVANAAYLEQLRDADLADCNVGRVLPTYVY
jgi:hypothetical protein